MTRPADLTAVELLAAYRSRRLSPVDTVADVIARIEESEPHLNALFAFAPDEARETARASERRWQRGEALALDGVPVTVKENIATRGVPVPLGTAARPLVPAEADAPPAARLREAGAVILAKTTMPDFGMLSSGLSSFHPLTRNPWDLALNPGGSSAGAGAAAAAGYGPIHLGTDIGGSIRLPGAWCGVVGLKPSFGRVPIHPPYYGRVAGPVTRTVADTALAMGVLSRPDPRDGTSLPPADIAWDDLALGLPGLRVGLHLDAGLGLPVDPEVAAAVEAIARRLEAEGATLVPVPPFLTRTMLDGLDAFWRQRAWVDLAAMSDDEQARVLPYIFRWAAAGRALSGEAVYRGMAQMGAMRDAALDATRDLDLMLSPVAPVVAFPAELASPLDDPERPFEHIVFTVPYNFSEQPAASVNVGFTRSGLPIGLQVAGRRFDDRGVLALAAAVERLRDPQRDWPTAFA